MWSRRPGITFVNARIASTTGVARTMRVAAGRIASLHTGPQRGDVVVDCRDATILPGLVNAHDHLARNHFGRLKWRERYANVREWIEDFQRRFGHDPALTGPMAVPAADTLWAGALKNLLSGVTTVCHHDPPHPEMRRRLPIRVASRFGYSHSLLIDGEAGVAAACRRTPPGQPWIVHAAEGVDAEAAVEFQTLERLGCLGPNTVLVHGVALDAAARNRLASAGGGLVWCPSSNLFLFGRTVDPRDLAARGRVALGTDSRLSGARDILGELAVARDASGFGPAELGHLVLDRAADLLKLPHAGRITVGLPADVTMWPARGRGILDCLVGTARADLLLVLVGGRPLLADPDMAGVFDASQEGPAMVRVDDRVKLLARRVADRASTLAVPETGLMLDAESAA